MSNIIVVAGCIAAIVFAYAYAMWDSWKQDDAARRHDRQRSIRVWRTIDKYEQYGYHIETPDHVPAEWSEAA